jgi:hypothetical protein
VALALGLFSLLHNTNQTPAAAAKRLPAQVAGVASSTPSLPAESATSTSTASDEGTAPSSVTPSDTLSPSATLTNPATELTQALAIQAIVARSAPARSAVAGALTDLEACGAIQSDISALRKAASVRADLLQRSGALSLDDQTTGQTTWSEDTYASTIDASDVSDFTSDAANDNTSVDLDL